MKWNLIVRRKLSILFYDLITLGQPTKEIQKIMGSGLGIDYYRAVNGDVEQGEENLKEIETYYENKFNEKGITYLIEMLDRWKKDAKELIEKAEEISKKDFSSSSDKELIKEFDELKEKYYKFGPALNLTLVLGSIAEKRIAEIAKGNEEHFGILTMPERDTEGSKEYKSFLRICDRKDDEEIKKHITEFGWINTRGFLGNEWNADEVKARIDETDEDHIGKLNDIEECYKRAKEKTEEIHKEINTTNEQKEMVKLAKELVAFRTDRMDFFVKAGFLSRPLFREIAKRTNLDMQDLFCLLSNEIEKAFLEGKDYKGLIKERKKGFAFFNIHGEVKVLSGRELEEFLEKNKKEEVENVDEIKGKIAYKGYVKGIAKVVIDKDQINKIEKGDILIASMTTPDYITAMEKAAAFVTDEGGILCHAAIIAREMKKPCVIGTKISTKIFKDGDIVEVDAENGIVRKVNK
ncbi:MAG: PEP-utilizing enzyme [Candidatus Woesearchaeota archaeon]